MSDGNVIPLDQVTLPFVDTNSIEYIRDPFTVMAQARASDPRKGRIIRTPYGIEIIDYDLSRQLLMNKGLSTPQANIYKERGAGPLLLKFMEEGKLTAQQGERHLLYRRVLSTQLTPQATREQTGLYFDVANRLVDKFIDKGRCEFIDDFSHPYPFEILCRALSIPPEDIPIFDSVTRALPLLNVVPLHPHVEEIEHALQVLSDYTSSLIDQPDGTHQGFIAEMVGHLRAGIMTRDEVVWSLITLLQASHYTTRTQLASIVRVLLETNTWPELVADKSLIPAAVEEGMRYYPVVLAVPRVVATPDFEIDGVAMPAGTFIRFNFHGGSRDDRRFDDPDRFDIHRNTSKRIPFGYGAHKCLGHTMARKDMEVAIEVMIERMKNPRIVAPIENIALGAGWGPGEVHIEFDR
ncbi:cytochrome P450 [Sphingomonas sp. AOB5]|uniref:cytochrome P450 n=1 Tax=Sphingomonas sp. AOB5 TaxID=3034017 RepID=UPI0023F83A9C|nr:cytochrome P450 [Sphingomonas sp. AOB5]MDF7774862.1 cytochrome P450 [Sphingomonas sp. AOB5]